MPSKVENIPTDDKIPAAFTPYSSWDVTLISSMVSINTELSVKIASSTPRMAVQRVRKSNRQLAPKDKRMHYHIDCGYDLMLWLLVWMYWILWKINVVACSNVCCDLNVRYMLCSYANNGVTAIQFHTLSSLLEANCMYWQWVTVQTISILWWKQPKLRPNV